MRWLWMMLVVVALGASANSGTFSGTFTLEGETVPPVEPPEPPIDPPPIDPPPPSGSRAWWLALCERPETVACTGLEGVEEVFTRAPLETGVPNSPASPLINGKCDFNGGDRECFPAFGANVDEETGQPGAIEAPNLFTCEKRRDYIDELVSGRVQLDPDDREQRIFVQSLWAPCFSEGQHAAKLVEWSQRGSSIGHLGIEQWSDHPPFTVMTLNFEVMFHESFWRVRKGSATGKFARVEVVKAYGCGSELLDLRLLEITEQHIEFGFGHWCLQRFYSEGPTLVRLMKDQHADQWIRFSYRFDHGAALITARAELAASGEVIMDGSQAFPDPPGAPGVLQAADLRILLHSTSHQPCTSPEECQQYPPGAFYSRYWSVQIE